MKHRYFKYIDIDKDVLSNFLEKHADLKKFISADKPFSIRISKKLYPSLIHSIICQNETNENALQIAKSLNEKLKGNIKPKKVIKLSNEELVSIFKSEVKANLVKQITLDVIKKKLNLKNLPKCTEEKIYETFSAYKDLLLNTVKTFAIFSCFKNDVFCNEDEDFIEGLKIFLGRNHINEYEFNDIKREYKNESTLFSLCMWRIKNEKVGEQNMSLKNEPITLFIKKEIVNAIKKYVKQNPDSKFNADINKINVDKSKSIKFGDFTSNFVLSLNAGSTPKRELAQRIVDLFDKDNFSKIEVAGPGFINFYLTPTKKLELLNAINDEQDNYGNFQPKKLFYNIEYVSANPTGLLHIGHARNGAYGDSLARLFEAYGIKVDKEYYINDGGNQINKLALSVLIRYLQLYGKQIELPEDSYHAGEIIETAKLLKEKYGDKFVNAKFDENKILDSLPNEEIGTFAKNYLLSIIKDHLNKLNVRMDIWSPESDIYKLNLIPKTFELLGDNIYKNEGATWLKTTKYGDDKDRVLVKSDGNYTYFTPDIAYHNQKLSRGYDKIFNIWGADHKSYVDRMSIAIQMLGYKKEQLHVCIMQLVQLTKNGEEFKMSKRSGNSFTTIDLINLIGKDAARWYLVNQSLDTHITIDIEKAAKKSNENGLFYVQYAYVRIKQILAKCDIEANKQINLLTNDIEQEIINQLFFFMPTIENIAKTYEVHKMCLYLTNLAKLIHNLYEKVRINDPANKELTAQRLFLINCVATVIKNGLKLLGIDVVENM